MVCYLFIYLYRYIYRICLYNTFYRLLTNQHRCWRTRGRNEKQSERMKYIWSRSSRKKYERKSKVFCGIWNANHVRAPYPPQNDFRGRKNFYSRPNRPSVFLPPYPHTALSSSVVPRHPLSPYLSP